jgi:(1->4)-alpha-D-glucan 1-alpha-D-glucosylmutase
MLETGPKQQLRPESLPTNQKSPLLNFIKSLVGKTSLSISEINEITTFNRHLKEQGIPIIEIKTSENSNWLGNKFFSLEILHLEEILKTLDLLSPVDFETISQERREIFFQENIGGIFRVQLEGQRASLENGCPDFYKLQEVLPKLAKLGISTLYLPPIFEVIEDGYTRHGYNRVSNKIDPNLGGEEGFALLVQKAKELGINIIVDVVPNHDGMFTQNPNIQQVLKYGQSFPTIYDINLDSGNSNFVMPDLGDNLEKTWESAKDYGENGEKCGLRFDNTTGEICFRYWFYDGKEQFPRDYPINIVTLPVVFKKEERNDLPQDFVSLLEEIEQNRNTENRSWDGNQLKFWEKKFKHILGQNENLIIGIENKLASINSEDNAKFLDIMNNQFYNLEIWYDLDSDGKKIEKKPNYNTFFGIKSLIKIDYSKPEAVTSFVNDLFRLYKMGVKTFRFDHYDGIIDPNFINVVQDRIAELVEKEVPEEERMGQSKPYLDIIVEQILEHNQESVWGSISETGYPLMGRLNTSLTNQEGLGLLNNRYQELNTSFDSGTDLSKIKREYIETNLDLQFNEFSNGLFEIAQKNGYIKEPNNITKQDIKNALIEYTVNLPVYRTYMTTEGLIDRGSYNVTDQTLQNLNNIESLNPQAIELLISLFNLNVSIDKKEELINILLRLQTETGPVTAKAQEDTLMYRLRGLITAADVGSSISPVENQEEANEGLHQLAKTNRVGEWATVATHDTKWGLDTRIRGSAMSEYANDFIALFDEVQNSFSEEELDSFNLKTVLWEQLQTILCTIPSSMQDLNNQPYLERLRTNLTKSLREAKIHTDWINKNDNYENNCLNLLEKLVTNIKSLDNFNNLFNKISKSSSQKRDATEILLFLGNKVPETYFGTYSEELRLSMVDPDNRRPADYSTILDPNQNKIAAFRQKLIKIRRLNADLLMSGEYIPMKNLPNGWFGYTIKNGEKSLNVCARMVGSEEFDISYNHILKGENYLVY